MASEPIDPNDFEALKRRIAELEAAQQANVSGSGAAAQGGGDALGERGVKVDGENAGPINTGRQTITTQGGAAVQGAVQAGGHFIGRDFVQFVTKVIQGNEDPEEAKSVIALYLHALAADLAGLKLGEIDTSAVQRRRTPLQLADIYVPLDTTLRIPKDVTLAHCLSREPDRQRDEINAEREARAVSALEALGEHRELTVLGKPGSGNLRRERSADARPSLAGSRRRAGEIGRDLGTRRPAAHPRRPAPLRRRAPARRQSGPCRRRLGLHRSRFGRQRLRSVHRCDEVRAAYRAHSRPYAWPSAPTRPEACMRCPISTTRRSSSSSVGGTRPWSNASGARPARPNTSSATSCAARHRPDLLPLAQNPLLLTLMATLHTNRGRLPDDRADLYNESVDLLLLRWNRQIGADKALLDELAIPCSSSPICGRCWRNWPSRSTSKMSERKARPISARTGWYARFARC